LDKVAHASLIAPRPAWFDERLLRSQDIEMWLRMALVGGSRFAGLGAILTEYRMREGGLSAQIAPKYASWLQVAACLDAYAPAFRQRYFARARAYQLRYLARRAVQLGDGRAALRYAGASLASSLAPLWQEPRRTLVTLAAAGAAFVLPRGAIVKLAGWLSGGALVDAPAPARSAA
ncbi:MAG TPA: hypothetical protein VFF94_07515, partial [Novosphingobium sp.]|nr:hypothetical protein [Novosphingobium sp.]